MYIIIIIIAIIIIIITIVVIIIIIIIIIHINIIMYSIVMTIDISRQAFAFMCIIMKANMWRRYIRYFVISQTKPSILRVLIKTHISEAFRVDFVNKSMFLWSTTKPPIFSIGGRFDQKTFFMRGVIVRPSKLIVTNICPLQGGVSC